MIVISSNVDAIAEVKSMLHDQFWIKDLGVAKYFLGLELTHSSAGILLSQKKYTLDILNTFGFLDSSSISAPLDTVMKYSDTDGDLLDDITQYRGRVGKLLYLTITRPDIPFAVQQSSKFLDRPTLMHLKGAHRILRYLKGTATQGLFFPAT